MFVFCLTLTLLLPTVKSTHEFPALNRLVIEEQSPKSSSSPDHIFDTCRPLGRQNSWRDVTAVHADKATLGKFSLECHGIKVLDETDPESGARRFDGERVINAFTKMESTSRDEDAIHVQREVGGENLKDLKAGKCPNKMAIWKKVKALLKENVPKCWRKKGYTSLSKDYDGACETQQTEESCVGGCHWNPIEEIWLIHEAKFAKYGSYTDKLLKGNVWKDNSLKEQINGHSVFYRLGGLTREDMTTILNPEEVDGYDEDIMWVKRELVKDKTVDEKAHRAMVEAVLRNKIINHHRLDHRTQMLTNQLCGTEDDQDHVSGFPVLHNDLIVDGMKHLYDWASGDPGAPSRQLHKRFKSAAQATPVEVEEKPLYFMEMGNYWTPLDPYPLAVNPLGWRVDTPDGKPWSSKGRVDVQASPQMCGAKKGLPMNVAYGTLHNQGLFFLTRYLQHSALPLMDLKSLYANPEKNCRHSIEFRFLLMAANPREAHSENTPEYSGEDFQNDPNVPHCMTGALGGGDGEESTDETAPAEENNVPTLLRSPSIHHLVEGSPEEIEENHLTEGSPAEVKQEHLADAHGADAVTSVDVCFGG